MTASFEGRSRRRRWLLAIAMLILAAVGGGLLGLHMWTRVQRRTADRPGSSTALQIAGQDGASVRERCHENNRAIVAGSRRVVKRQIGRLLVLPRHQWLV